MLYVTTRDNTDAYTPYRVLREERGQDGGLYVPFRLPHMNYAEILKFQEKSFNTSIADILNLLFNTRISPWDVDFAIGRYAVRLVPMSQKIIIGECWHNLNWEFSCIVKSLPLLLQGHRESKEYPSEWTEIAVRIAVLFGIFGELMRSGILEEGKTTDISVVSGNFSAPMGAWYARAMGLPVGNIICCCNENNAIWELFRYGHLRTDGVAEKTALPEADVVIPFGLERLIYSVGGCREVGRYMDSCRTGSTYHVEDRLLEDLQRGMYVTVSSQSRIAATVINLYKTDDCILSPYAALAYSGLQDFRAGTGSWGSALILSDKSPVCDGTFVSENLGIPETEILKYL